MRGSGRGGRSHGRGRGRYRGPVLPNELRDREQGDAEAGEAEVGDEVKLAHAGRDAALRGLQDRKERRRLKRRRGPTPEEVAKEKRRRASQDAAARGGAGRGGAVRPASQNGGVTARDPAAARRDPAQTQKPSKRQLTLADLDARLGLGTTAEEDDAAEAELARKLGGSGPKSRRKEREEEEEDVLAQLGLGGKRSAMQREVDRELGGSDEDDGSLDIFGEGGEGSESDGGSEGAADGASEGTSGDASNDEDEMGSGSLSMDGDGSDEESSDSEGEEGRAARGGEAGPSREGRYVPPAQRGAGAGRVGDLERRVRGLCNKLSVVNVKGIAEEVLTLVSTSAKSPDPLALVSRELVSAVAEGPKASDQFACAAAGLVAAVAAMRGDPGLLSAFLGQVAARLIKAIGAGDEDCCGNLGLLVAYLCLVGAIGGDVVLGLLLHLSRDLGEAAVSLMLLLVRACGHVARAEDPAGVKDLVLRVHEERARRGGELSTRARLMLEAVYDMKNNAGEGGKGPGGKAKGGLAKGARVTRPVVPPDMLTWLGGVGVSGVRVVGFAGWGEDGTAGGGEQGGEGEGVAPSPSVSEESLGVPEGDDVAGADPRKLQDLARALRMGSGVKRQVFEALMGASDYVDAADRVLRLPLKKAQHFEVARVAFELSMRERGWNKFYVLALQRVATLDRRIGKQAGFTTLDMIKQAERLGPLEASNLAHSVAYLLAHRVVPMRRLRHADLAQAVDPACPAPVARFWGSMLRAFLAEVRGEEALAALLADVDEGQRGDLARAMRAHASGGEESQTDRAMLRAALTMLEG